MKYELYEVGGKIRDEFLGLTSKDVDYSVVITDSFFIGLDMKATFDRFEHQIKSEGYEVFLSTPECFTIRAKFPKGHEHEGLVADFVLARKELGYIKGTRTPESILGTLQDDLERRDFTVNAIAKSVDGTIIDPFNGIRDLQLSTLRTPLDAVTSFNDDPLRILRALRFSVTKSFGFSDEVVQAISLFNPKLMDVVSEERIKDEMFKMFKHDTSQTLTHLEWLRRKNPRLFERLFNNNIWLMPTNKR